MEKENLHPKLAAVDANALLAAIVESSDDAIISKDLHGTIISWNKGAERIFGYTAEEVVGGPISVIIPPDKGGEEIDILNRISRGERFDHYETVRVRKNGTRIEVAVTISPLWSDGKVVGASKIARDVTEQRRLERLIEQERVRLEVTLASIGDAVIVTDPRGAVTFMNPVAESLTGWTLSEARGMALEAVFNIVNESTRRRADNPAVRALKEGVIVGLANHTVLISRSGVEYAIDDSAAPVRDANDVFGVVLVFRDVSGLRAAEDYRARLAAIVESSDDAIISKDLNGRIKSWNAGATRLFGYTPDEVIGRPISIIIPPERLSEEPEILARMRSGDRIEHFETVRVTKDRRKVEVSLTVSPIRDMEGHIIGASKIARDISSTKRAERDLKEAQEQLQSHSERLEKTVAERTAELREALSQLETFSYSISHDLRAPLRAINGFVDVILKEHSQELDNAGRELLERVAQSSTRLGLLVAEVLSSTRLKLNDSNLRPVILSNVVPSIIADYPNLSEHREAIEIRHPLDPVIGNEPLLTQCISNLLGNAIKFVPPERRPKIQIWTVSKDGKVRLFIRDNGVGIKPDDEPRIFDLFSRGENAAGLEGSGIGLAVAKRAVLRMGGAIGVCSKPNVGSDFWIELPSAQSGNGQAQLTASHEAT